MPKLVLFLVGIANMVMLSAQQRVVASSDPREANNQQEQLKKQDLLRDQRNFEKNSLERNAESLNKQLSGLPAKISYGGIYPSFSNNYPILSFTPIALSHTTPWALPFSAIKIIDARYATDKVGFIPVSNTVQKKGLSIIGLQINNSVVNWLQEALAYKNIQLDSNSNRQLVIVIRKFWFSNQVNKIYSASNPELLTSLDYQFDLYSSKDIGYYPQKIISGNLIEPYGKGEVYAQLTDSLYHRLKIAIQSQDYASREIEQNWQSPIDFNDYYNNLIRNATHFEKTSKGLYASYNDFLNNRPVSDSVEFIFKYNNYDRAQLYACQISAFKEGLHIPSIESWGYYDGSSIYLNVGRGFFIRLLKSKSDYIFYFLKNIKEERIHKDQLETIRIAESDYLLLKDYQKAFALTYRLNLDTGKLQ